MTGSGMLHRMVAAGQLSQQFSHRRKFSAIVSRNHVIRINHIFCSSSVDAVVNGTPIDTYHNGSNMIASVS